MNFTAPLTLLLLLLLIPYFVWLGRPRPAPGARWREPAILALRLLILTLLVLSLAGAQAVRAADDLAVVFLIDASDSITSAQAEEAETFVRAAINAMPPSDQAAIVLFGANALVERPMSGLAEMGPIRSTPERLHTNLAEAIRLGLALYPAGSARRMVILSDGIATLGDTVAAGQLAAATGVEISYVPLAAEPVGDEAWLTGVNAPTRVIQGETFRIDVTAESTADMPATLRVLAAGSIVHQEQVQLRRGVNNFALRLRATGQEFARYRVQLDPARDTYYQNNELAAFTEVVGPPRILLVAQDGGLAANGAVQPEEWPQLRLALQAAGLSVERLTPTELPASLEQLGSYAAIVLVNVNAADLTPRKMELLQSYVRDLGGGLAVVGGPQSYGMGGYFQTPLEEALPVEMQITDQERFPSISIVIVIDRSGSMGVSEGGLTKIQLAAEGAVRVVELLNDFDEITVIPVDTQPYNPIGPLPASDRETAVAQIRQISAGGGGIYMRNGLEAAAAALAQSDKQVKHIIVLADGADAEQKEGVPELLRALTAEGVTISMVSIGFGADTAWLEQMAEVGNGRYHFTDQAANLPQIFAQEATSVQRSYLVEERFFPDLANRSPILTGITAVPPLYGYVATSPKNTAQVILNTHQGDPLLAAWQYGLGRAVAWTSDATGRWAVDWVRWDGFATFWAQAVRWTISPERDNLVETAVVHRGREARLTVDARDENGRWLNNLVLEASIVGPDGAAQQITLPQVAPGRYEGDFVPRAEGAYLIRLTGMEPEAETAVLGQTTGWVLAYSPEYRHLEPDSQLLASLARLTGGQALSSHSAVFAHTLPGEVTTRPIWSWLTLLAVLLLPVDVALRRLVINRRDLARAWAAIAGRWRSTPAAPTPRPEQVARLFQAKQRAGVDRFSPHAAAARETAAPDPDKAPPVDSPAAPPSSSKTAVPPAGDTLAARLLEKKRQQNEKNQE